MKMKDKEEREKLFAFQIKSFAQKIKALTGVQQLEAMWATILNEQGLNHVKRQKTV